MSCGHTRRGIASSSCTGVRPRPQAIPECSRLKRALLEVAAELRRSVRARTLGLLLLLRAFRPSSRKLRRLSTSKDERQAYRRLVRRDMFGISPDPSVLQIPKEKGLGPPNNGPKL